MSTIPLPCAVVPPANKKPLAEKLGLSEEALEQVLSGRAAFVRDQVGVTKLIAESDFEGLYPDRSFADYCCADGIASHAPDLVIRQLDLVPERARLLEPGPLEPPIDDIDDAYLGIIMRAEYLRRLIELDAPEILLRNTRVVLQHALEDLVSLSEGKPRERWEPYTALMTGPPSSTLCAEPPEWSTSNEQDLTVPLDCCALRDGFLVMYPLTSVVLGSQGEVRDVFPTKGLRVVGDSDGAILFVAGGGPTSATGYFDPAPVVRDVAQKRWVVGDRPAGLPRYVAGAIGDVKWAIVADLDRGMGYRISPNMPGDQCGGTTTSVDGVHAYDSGYFVIEAATGKRVLDVRHLFHEVRSFVRRDDGAWRFLGIDLEEEDEDEEADPRPPRLIVFDESGALVRELPFSAGSLMRDGRTALCASTDELIVIDVDSGERKRSIDLQPLRLHLVPNA